MYKSAKFPARPHFRQCHQPDSVGYLEIPENNSRHVDKCCTAGLCTSKIWSLCCCTILQRWFCASAIHLKDRRFCAFIIHLLGFALPPSICRPTFSVADSECARWGGVSHILAENRGVSFTLLKKMHENSIFSPITGGGRTPGTPCAGSATDFFQQ